MSRGKTIQQFIEEAWCVHGDRYNYSLVEYKNNKTKVKIICPEHGTFEQIAKDHIFGKGCQKCSNGVYNKNEFIIKAHSVHNNKYNYTNIKYKCSRNKIEIICPIHGAFKQLANNHLQGRGCPKCAGRYNKEYRKNNIPLYDTYVHRLETYGTQCRRNIKDDNILEVKCYYNGCRKWFIPKRYSVLNRIRAINGSEKGEQNLYCSEGCKYSCPTYYQKLYPKDHKPATSREVQPQLRKLVLERDNWTCQKCGNKDYLHCHHIDPVANNPIESADVDNCITYCVECHKESHQQDGCGHGELRC